MIAAETLLTAYASGWFPMSVAPGDIRWYSPDPRGIIPLDAFPAPPRLARPLRHHRVRRSPRPGRQLDRRRDPGELLPVARSRYGAFRRDLAGRRARRRALW